MAFTQDNRLISVSTPLGKDVLLLQDFVGFEAVSRLFHFKLDVLSEVNAAISPKDILNQRVTIGIMLADGSLRNINGWVSQFTQTAKGPRFTAYQMEVVPWLWYLTRTADCRIFQNQSVPDIISAVFSDFGFNDFTLKLQGSHEPWEYCVQYRETAFNFVSRLMEQEGIFYFFKHEEQKHTLVLADSPDAFVDGGKSRYVYNINYEDDVDVITGWGIQDETRPGQYALGDFNFEKPQLNLTSVTPGKGQQQFEVFDYPGEYLTKSEGETLTEMRMQEEESPERLARGSGFCRYYGAGLRFELVEHYRRDFNAQYVLTEVQHSASIGDNYHTSGAYGKEFYSNQFTAIPWPKPYRPPRTTPRPIVQGPQTAIVTGPKGEEIYVDKYGRVKVQFHWDRRGKYDEKSSCWMRVSQMWAGKNWGAMVIPRIGQEVIVDFLEGDPDQPIIVGRVYNGEEMPPYKLPDEKTKTTLKSYSSKGGGGFNEIRIDDKKGDEQLFFHAEKDHHTRVKNNLFETIASNRHLIVGASQYEQVGGDLHLTVKGDQNEDITGTVSLKAGMDWQGKVGMNYALDSGMEIHLKSGLNMVLESGLSLTLKVGGNFINLSPVGVTISGTMVLINSGGAAGSGAGAKPEKPKAPQEADKAEPGQKSKMPPPKSPPPTGALSPMAIVMRQAAEAGSPFCDI